jgi:hypothetical protein
MYHQGRPEEERGVSHLCVLPTRTRQNLQLHTKASSWGALAGENMPNMVSPYPLSFTATADLARPLLPQYTSLLPLFALFYSSSSDLRGRGWLSGHRMLPPVPIAKEKHLGWSPPIQLIPPLRHPTSKLANFDATCRQRARLSPASERGQDRQKFSALLRCTTSTKHLLRASTHAWRGGGLRLPSSQATARPSFPLPPSISLSKRRLPLSSK